MKTPEGILRRLKPSFRELIRRHSRSRSRGDVFFGQVPAHFPIANEFHYLVFQYRAERVLLIDVTPFILGIIVIERIDNLTASKRAEQSINQVVSRPTFNGLIHFRLRFDSFNVVERICIPIVNTAERTCMATFNTSGCMNQETAHFLFLKISLRIKTIVFY